MNQRGSIIPIAMVVSVLIAGIGLFLQQLTGVEVRNYLSITDKIEGFYGAEILGWHDRRRATDIPTPLSCPVTEVGGKCPTSLVFAMDAAPGVGGTLAVTPYVYSSYGGTPLNILDTTPIVTNPNLFRKVVASGHFTVPNASPFWCGSMQASTNGTTRQACLVHPPPFFLVADRQNNRVLLWMNRPSQLPVNPIVLGQVNTTSGTANQGGSPTGSTLNHPRTPSWDGKHLLVSDTDNNRVLVWNKLPKTNAQMADVVLGQPDFISAGPNRAPSPTSTPIPTPTSDGLRSPNRIHSDGTRVFVSDNDNNRILIWNTFPTANGTPADVVVGQLSMTGKNFGLTDKKIKNPFGVHSNGVQLVVSDFGNNRVLIWNPIPTSNGTAASVVVGQADFVSGSANQGLAAPTAQTLSAPIDSILVNGKLIVVDDANNRVLVWNAIPTLSNQAADLVLGQNSMTTSTPAAGATGMNGPIGVYSSGNDLWVSDAASRILIWDTFPTVSGQPADRVLGQVDFTGTSPNMGAGGPTKLSLSTPVNVTSNLDLQD